MIPTADPFALPNMANVAAVPGAATARVVRELDSPGDRDLAWYLQGRSIMPGGLKAVAEEIWQASAGKSLGSAMMHRLGRRIGQVYEGDDFLAIFAELNDGSVPNEITELRNLIRCAELEAAFGRLRLPGDDNPTTEIDESRAHIASLHKELRRLCNRPASELLADCRRVAAAGIPGTLRSFANEGRPIEAVYFQDLRAAVEENRRAFAAAGASAIASTAIAETVTEELAAIAGAQTLGLIQGNTREGKTTAAQAFTRGNLHCCRYASLEDDLSDRRFYEILVNAVSGPIDARWVKDDFRAAISGALVGSGLMLIIDEAHNLFPRNPKNRPVWLEWVRTALVDRGVSVALISTPQFVGRIKSTAQASGWQSDQFTGRIGKFRTIHSLAEDDQAGWDRRREDVGSVARCHLPEVDSKAITYMADVACMGRTPFHLVATMARDARETARRRGESVCFSDVRAAAEKAAQFNGQIFRALQPEKKQRGHAEPIGRKREITLPPRPPSAMPDTGVRDEPIGAIESRLQAGSRIPGIAEVSVPT